MQSLLIANRGEIAVRVIRTCREMGIRTVAIYSEADSNSIHVKLADKSLCIGPSEPSRSYLDIPRVMSALEVSGADGVHPGYGFLSENPRFAEIVRASGKVFVGPSPEALELIGDKVKAREIAKKVGLPLLPGSDGPVDFQKALEVASTIGYPVVIKAAAGGGGRGIRVVNNEKELREKFPLATQEAEVAFGDGRLYVVPQILEALYLAVKKGLRIPIVYNTSSYDSLESLKLLDGIVDIYLADFKYGDSSTGRKYSKVKSYYEVALEAIREMHRQVGDLKVDEEGIAIRGLLIRHLVLPNGLAGTQKVLESLKEISPQTYINIMDQYRPYYKAYDYPELSRRIYYKEYQEALNFAKSFKLVLD